MKLPTAADLIDIAKKKLEEECLEKIHQLNLERMKRDNEIEQLKHSHIDEEMIETIIRQLKQAAEAGKSKTIAYRFPSEACLDKGRTINNALPKWEDSLVGQPLEFFEFYRQELYPQGYRLRASILDYPGGRLGEVGFTISWEAPITTRPKSPDQISSRFPGKERPMKVRNIMSINAIRILNGATMAEAAELAAMSNASGLFVIDDENTFLGVLSEGDMMNLVLPEMQEIMERDGDVRDSYDIFHEKGVKLAAEPIIDHLIANPITLDPDDLVLKAAATMSMKKMRRLPVVKNKKLVGTVSRGDICRAIFANGKTASPSGV